MSRRVQPSNIRRPFTPTVRSNFQSSNNLSVSNRQSPSVTINRTNNQNNSRAPPAPLSNNLSSHYSNVNWSNVSVVPRITNRSRNSQVRSPVRPVRSPERPVRSPDRSSVVIPRFTSPVR